MKLSCLVAFAGILLSSVSNASSGNRANYCRGLWREDPPFRIGKILGSAGSKIHFLSDDDECPKAGGAKCIQKAYLIPGDEVIVANSYEKWVCTAFVSRKKNGDVRATTTGWIPASQLQLAEPNSKPSPSDWVGRWSNAGPWGLIEIKEGQNGELEFLGEAIWKGSPDNIHVGDMGGSEKPQGNHLENKAESKYSCGVRMTLVNQYLVVDDNGHCGGANVSFSEIYLKTQWKKWLGVRGDE